MTPTTIEWTDLVWNPTTGCDRVSPGCDHCYALTMAKRLKGMGSAKYQNDGDPRTSGPGFGITEHATALNAPLSWRKPRKVFVNSMSDLFHDGVSDGFIRDVWSVMHETPQHTYQVLTKRHGRMRSFLSKWSYAARPEPWPLPNVWGGVSVEDQKRADLRVPALAETPLAVRWLSCEPLLGPVDVSPWLDQIDWVVVGGESGPGARVMDPRWARDLRDQCAAYEVPFLFKQWGETAPLDQLPEDALASWEIRNGPGYPGATQCQVGKHAAGRELDGRTWDEYPAARAVPSGEKPA